MEKIEERWQDFLPDFDFPQANGFYVFGQAAADTSFFGSLAPPASRATLLENETLRKTPARGQQPQVDHCDCR
jgi:hypothetical protein